MVKYIKDYKWSNIFEMVRNLKSKPRICQDSFGGKLAVITGATSGIGYATAEKFASRGADLLFINRNKQKSEDLCQKLRSEYGAQCDYLLADFSKLADTHAAADALAELDRRIDVLIHNAGTFNTRRAVTQDGMEAVFQTNYLSSFILNHKLTKKFLNQASGRILFVNSEAYRFSAFGLHMDDLFWEKHAYAGIKSYGAAKLAQLLSMLKFSDIFANSGVTINAMHPGNIKTNSGQNNGKIYKLFKKTVVDRGALPVDYAAEALYFLSASPEVAGLSNKFFNLTTEEEPAPPALDRAAAEELWNTSMRLGGLNE